MSRVGFLREFRVQYLVACEGSILRDRDPRRRYRSHERYAVGACVCGGPRRVHDEVERIDIAERGRAFSKLKNFLGSHVVVGSTMKAVVVRFEERVAVAAKKVLLVLVCGPHKKSCAFRTLATKAER